MGSDAFPRDFSSLQEVVSIPRSEFCGFGDTTTRIPDKVDEVSIPRSEFCGFGPSQACGGLAHVVTINSPNSYRIEHPGSIFASFLLAVSQLGGNPPHQENFCERRRPVPPRRPASSPSPAGFPSFSAYSSRFWPQSPASGTRYFRKYFTARGFPDQKRIRRETASLPGAAPRPRFLPWPHTSRKCSKT